MTITPCTACGTPTRRGRCADCRNAGQRARGPRLYDRRAWRDRKRPAYLRRHPMCEFHTPAGRLCPNRATDVDHVIPLSQGGADDESNYQAACHPHHSAKTARESGLGLR